MARIRTIKPDFWKHEDLSELPPETHMLAAALLNYADDEGYFNANPKLIQAECCPLRDDSTNVRRSIDELSRIGYIRLFSGTDGKQYGHVVTFSNHQRVDRPNPSKIKVLEDSTKDRRKIDEQSTEEGKGREGKGREKTRSQLLADFDCFWNEFDSAFGEKGSKKKAQEEYLKLKPDDELFLLMSNRVKEQIADKKIKSQADQFTSPFQHVERWIKNQRWEDELGGVTGGKNGGVETEHFI